MRHWIALLLLMGSSLPWATAGADPARHWAFQPVRDPALPTVTNAAWCRTSLDRFILARLEAKGLAPAPPAEARTWIRRATLDLTGLPSSAAEIDTFAADSAPDRAAKWVDRLLDSPHYGEHWGRHWLDVVRYADTAGETADYPVPVAWRYRNYVIDAFNADKPYDEFLREQIAGDILARGGPRERYAERVTATGYLAISRRFGFDSENYHHLTIQDTIDNVGQSVLGLTLGCARCHNHKFDPVSLTDYYALYGIFDSTRYAFPGSEQKQKSRALAPLLPPEESRTQWQAYEKRVAALTRKLEQQKKSPPTAILRSLDELDGDFELQAPAAGGSNGVLVPPWDYEGPIAVTQDAQSPFKNLHPSGRVGASVSGVTNGYRIAQALHPGRNRQQGGQLHVNLDVRLSTNEPGTAGTHRFWLGTQPAGPAVEILWSATNVSIRTGNQTETIRTLQPGQWHNLQLTLDLGAATVSGQVGAPNDIVSFSERPLASSWNGRLDFVALDAPASGARPLPSLALDNLGVQQSSLAPVSTTPSGLSDLAAGPDVGALTRRLRELVDLDGDFELQTDHTKPSTPWGPGPNSVVQIQPSAQSPFRNLYPAGQRGIHLPNSGDYNGFDQALPVRREAKKDGLVFASYDFRCTSADAGGNGTWRFYLGHGAGGSAAVELSFNATEFFRRSGPERAAIGPVRLGEWYQVQLALNLETKNYTGTLSSGSSRLPFSGEFAQGWDGIIDFVFVDSHGHIGGVKPAVDLDNFAVGTTRFPALNEPALAATAATATDAIESRRTEIAALRQQLETAAAAAEKDKQELEALLIDGPFALTYAVSEGTPRNSRVQLRGEPDKPGDVVPRGFLKILGGGPLPADTEGSGRRELAEWLTRPDNPLTARVMVNRLWQYHFGQGLVRTPNDFGARGLPPSHPELLDHLATQFIRSGWSIKAMHRLIMASAVYQQASQYANPGPASPAPRLPLASAGMTDPCPVLSPTALARAAELPTTDDFAPFPRRRLGAEETRDAILLVSGQLDPTPGQGHPFPAPTRWGYTQHGPFGAVYEHRQRSVYLMTQRIRRHPFLALFDGPDPNASTAERRTTTVPTQALYFLNDPFVHANAERFAAACASQSGESAYVEKIYRQALGRSPNATERNEAASFLSAYRDELAAGETKDAEANAQAAFARVLLGSNEFLTVD